MGRYHYPRHVLHVHEHPRAGYQNGVLCRFWGLVVGAPEGVAAPLGRVIFLLLSKLRLVRPAFSAFRMYGAGVVSLPSARFTCC